MSPLALSLRFLQAQPDARLVELARQGHEVAFEAVVRRYRNELLSYCRRLTPDAANAEDALQQALLQAWRALKSGAEVRDVRPWLYRIAHNVAISHLRSGRAAPRELEDGPGSFDVDQVVEQRLRARAALAGMASLPELQRQVLVSTTLDGASHEEVATALGLTSGSVRGLIYRARAALRTAAAAVIPSPALSWAIRHAEGRAGGTSAVVEAALGGGGLGVAGLVAKGGAVLALAGAVAGGGVLVSGTSAPRADRELPQPHSHRAGRIEDVASRARGGAVGDGLINARQTASVAPVQSAARARPGERGSSGGGPGGTVTSGRDGGSSGSSNGGSRDGGTSDGGSSSVIVSSGGATGSSSSGSSGGGTSGSSASNGGMGGTSGGQVTTAATTRDGGSGSSGGSSGSSGSGDTTTIPTMH